MKKVLKVELDTENKVFGILKKLIYQKIKMNKKLIDLQ